MVFSDFLLLQSGVLIVKFNKLIYWIAVKFKCKEFTYLYNKIRVLAEKDYEELTVSLQDSS